MGLDDGTGQRLTDSCVRDWEPYCSMVERAMHKALNSPTPLSWEMTQLLSAVIFGGFELFPARKEESGETPTQGMARS